MDWNWNFLASDFIKPPNIIVELDSCVDDSRKTRFFVQHDLVGQLKWVTLIPQPPHACPRTHAVDALTDRPDFVVCHSSPLERFREVRRYRSNLGMSWIIETVLRRCNRFVWRVLWRVLSLGMEHPVCRGWNTPFYYFHSPRNDWR